MMKAAVVAKNKGGRISTAPPYKLSAHTTSGCTDPTHSGYTDPTHSGYTDPPHTHKHQSRCASILMFSLRVVYMPQTLPKTRMASPTPRPPASRLPTLRFFLALLRVSQKRLKKPSGMTFPGTPSSLRCRWSSTMATRIGLLLSDPHARRESRRAPVPA